MSENTSNNTSTNRAGGVGFAGMLTLIFVTLKLLKIISWSWLWVLSPLWIGVAFWLFLLVLIVLGAVIMGPK